MFRDTVSHMRIAAVILCLTSVSGCGSDNGGLEGRAAMDVSVEIDQTPVQNGTLVLRPEPGVKCPLITVPIVDGTGHLSQAAGPIPGSYSASFRSSGADLTEQLTEAGRQNPVSGRKNQSSGRPQNTQPALQALTVVVPDSNPAQVTAHFVAE
jgi:hypothetical protein